MDPSRRGVDVITTLPCDAGLARLGLSVNSVDVAARCSSTRPMRANSDPGIRSARSSGTRPGKPLMPLRGGATAANNPSRPHSAVPTDSPTTHPRNLSTTRKHIKHIMMCERLVPPTEGENEACL